MVLILSVRRMVARHQPQVRVLSVITWTARGMVRHRYREATLQNTATGVGVAGKRARRTLGAIFRRMKVFTLNLRLLKARQMALFSRYHHEDSTCPSWRQTLLAGTVAIY